MTTETPRWFTSSYSENGGACVQVATNLAAPHGIVPVRDSKNVSGPALAVPAAAFTAFVAGVRAGDFGTA
ncbi:DUF397 domain-containing protein [Streptomyces anulatus]|uniref:DUF397 domain-containing protein n=1 Tax=Streptomyces TaxID=1883 RepID=UPI0006DB5B01|nr:MULTISPECIES: DUF397 domain-containing protein [Streptomyces]KPL31861.1 toxin-antitoxin system, toxin component [Streptomyces anulatus]KQX36592.1 toxin-antitoxin system, toxin component [Streptomyces sp. Root1295]KRA36600.1 toxin-antitoxin system, toxin component [Streptomyces sp. Root63]OKJ58623.1 toxin-antitoxin system, toxin component [Streptomyces sp. CB02115]